MTAIPARIDQITLAVTDLERAFRFYANGLGFKPEAESAQDPVIRRFPLGAVTLTLIEQETLLDEMHLQQFPPPPGPVTIAVVVPRDQVDEYVERGKQAGATVVTPAEDKATGPRIGFISDPDGHVWEILGP